jgi:hypothetical protein
MQHEPGFLSKFQRAALFSLLVAVVGCVDESTLVELDPAPPEAPSLEAPPTEAPFDVTPFVADEQEQGQYIIGSHPESLAPAGVYLRVPAAQNGFTLSVNPAGPKGINGTHLVGTDAAGRYTATDPWFNNKVLVGSGFQLEIRRSVSIGSGIVSTAYFLDYRPVTPAGVGAPVNYCGVDGGGAIPLAGYYDSRRTHKPGAFITFACKNGVARKCNAWGYPAGNGTPADINNWKYHQACTGMANARYCGDGQSFTREMTPIQIRDTVAGYGIDAPLDLGHPPSPPGEPDKYYIEAGWKEDGTTLCLSRSRWKALAPNQCGSTPPDPRYSNDPEAKFCEEWTIHELFMAGAWFVNGSKDMDMPLLRWRNGAGDEVLTVHGYFVDRNHDNYPDPGVDLNGDGISDTGSVPPFPGYDRYVGTEGMLLRNLPGTLLESQMHSIYARDAGTAANPDRYLDDIGGGRTDPGFQGYSFLSSPTVNSIGETISSLYMLRRCQQAGGMNNAVGVACNLQKDLYYVLPEP